MRRRSSRHKGYSAPIDRLGKSQSVTWVVAVDHWGRVRESRRLEPGTDLFDVLLDESLRYHRAGWQLTERPFFNCEFHIKREGEQQLSVHFTGCNPGLESVEAEGRYDCNGFYATLPTTGPYR